MEDNKKPIVIFTTFWDADYLIKNRFLLWKRNENIFKINLLFNEDKTPKNFFVHSIALSQPKNQLDYNNITRIDCFCPTYNLLSDYKDTKDWDSYTERYVNLMIKRKDRIKAWADNLEEERVYLLCCWENTKLGSHCHRKIVYEYFCKSKFMTDRMHLIYRDGDKTTETYDNDNDHVVETLIGMDMEATTTRTTIRELSTRSWW